MRVKSEIGAPNFGTARSGAYDDYYPWACDNVRGQLLKLGLTCVLLLNGADW